MEWRVKWLNVNIQKKIVSLQKKSLRSRSNLKPDFSNIGTVILKLTLKLTLAVAA